MKTAFTVCALLPVTLLFAYSGHSALNGTWTLVPAKSDFAGQPVVQSGTVTINDREGNVTVSRDFTYEGANQTFFYKDMIDSERSATIKTPDGVKSKARWDHDVLRVTTSQNGAVTSESYTLAPDGTMLVSVTKPGEKAFTLVFVRR
jgi:hypothetical protein